MKHTNRWFHLVPIFFGLVFSSSPAPAETVEIPLQLKLPLLKTLLLKQLFRDEGNIATLTGDRFGCNKIVLSEPDLGSADGLLRIESKLDADMGMPINGQCMSLPRWQGRAEVLGKPVTVPGIGSQLNFQVSEIRLFDRQGMQMPVGPLLEPVRRHIESYRIDLSGPVEDIRALLPVFLPGQTGEQGRKVIDSLRFEQPAIHDDRIGMALKFDIEPKPSEAPEPALTPEEVARWQEKWQGMDAFFTFSIKQFAAMSQSQELKDVLFEILIDSRIELQEALIASGPAHQDSVRRWFLNSWEKLSPVMLELSETLEGQDGLALISVISASGALEALDKLGPSFGLEISAEGMRRLARLINKNPQIDPLRYDESMDPELRRIFRFEEGVETEEESRFLYRLLPIGDASADTVADRLNQWIPGSEDLSDYLASMKGLLLKTADTVVRRNYMEDDVAGVFRALMLATAWKESCWRQYVVEGEKMVPLKTVGGTGLMQINERVWRGFYDPQRLRWDVAYNGRAGAEILYKYLSGYALKRNEHKRAGGLDNLARATYSAYNGGPGQVARYRNSEAREMHRKIDAVFYRKYLDVKQGREHKVAECFGVQIPEIPEKSAAAGFQAKLGRFALFPRLGMWRKCAA
ncbi:MAG: lytic transglycosylase domain-containing protein [Gammaproteobacteria bacterium]